MAATYRPKGLEFHRKPAPDRPAIAGPKASGPWRSAQVSGPIPNRGGVCRMEGAEKTKGGIIIPDTVKEKPQEGEVIAVGPGARDESGVGPARTQSGRPGTVRQMVRHRGQDRRRGPLIMKRSDVMGVIEGASATKKKAA